MVKYVWNTFPKREVKPTFQYKLTLSRQRIILTNLRVERGNAGGRSEYVFSSKLISESQLSLCAKGETQNKECQRECSLWGCKYLGLFTEPLTADLFLYSNDPNAFCLLHGNSFGKVWSISCGHTVCTRHPCCVPITDSFDDFHSFKPHCCHK